MIVGLKWQFCKFNERARLFGVCARIISLFIFLSANSVALSKLLISPNGGELSRFVFSFLLEWI